MKIKIKNIRCKKLLYERGQVELSENNLLFDLIKKYPQITKIQRQTFYYADVNTQFTSLLINGSIYLMDDLSIVKKIIQGKINFERGGIDSC